MFQEPCRITGQDAGLWHVPNHHRPRAKDGEISDCNSRTNKRVGADPDVVPDLYRKLQKRKIAKPIVVRSGTKVSTLRYRGIFAYFDPAEIV